MGAGGEKGDELAVTSARNCVCRGLRLLAALGWIHGFRHVNYLGSSHVPDGTNFDGAMACTGAAGSPGKSGIEVGNIDEEVTAELLFRVGKGAVEDLGLAVYNADGGGCGDGPQTVGALHGARFNKRLAVGHVGRHSLLLLFGSHACETGFVGVEKKKILHG